MPVSLEVNGETHVLDAPPTRRLLDVLRDDLGLTGTKLGCGEGACGACAVLLDGRPVASCLVLAGAAEGRAVTTIEGLSRRRLRRCRRRSSPRTRSSAASARLGRSCPRRRCSAATPQPTRDEIRAAMAGNLCRCGAYPKIERAILRAVGAGGRVRPRLVKTQREMEGRFEDVWALVDEDDDLETWPDDAELHVVGKPATRQDGPLRASGAARFTVDVALPGMLARARPALARRALPRDEPRPRRRARRRPASGRCSGRTGPFTMGGDAVLTAEPHYAGAADRRRRRRHAGGAQPRGSPRSRSSSRSSRRSTSTAASTSSASPRSRPRRSAATRTRALAAADVRVELTCETPAHVQTPLEPHAAVARWDGDGLTAWVSTQGMFDARARARRALRARRESVRVISEFIGGGFGAKQGAGRRGAPRRRARARHGPAGPARSATATRSSSTAAAAPGRARP